MSSKGFGSLSKARRKQISGAAGKKAHALGKAHQFDSVEAANASAKAVQSKKRKAAKRAAVRLMQAGFSPEQLVSLNLTYEEYMYYGGVKMTKPKLLELYKRLTEVQSASKSESAI